MRLDTTMNVRYLPVLTRIAVCLMLAAGCREATNGTRGPAASDAIGYFQLPSGEEFMDMAEPMMQTPEGRTRVNYIAQYLSLYYRVRICPRTPQYHAEKLCHSEDNAEIAYHIIALGMLRQDTPEVRSALERFVEPSTAYSVPTGYCWPDDAQAYEDYLETLMASDPNLSGEHPRHYPCKEHKFMSELARECLDRIGNLEGQSPVIKSNE